MTLSTARHTGIYKNHWHFSAPLNVNHGTAGATPVAILRRMAELDDAFNADRESFFWKCGLERVEQARQQTARFFHADSDDFVFTDNATESFNAVIKSVPLGPGDEVLVTCHIYANYPPMLREEAMRRGFTVSQARIPFPVSDETILLDLVLDAVTDRTKLVIVDHISSATALIFPVAALVRALEPKGIDVFIDGAHAPGQVEVNLPEIGAAYYAGNHHKWLCAPQTSGFLHVRKDRQDHIMPAVGSGFASREFPFAERFCWTGSRDMAARLLVPETINYMAALHPDGWPGIMRRNHGLALAVQQLFCDRLGREMDCPEKLTASMVSIPLGPLTFDSDTETLRPMLRFDRILEQRYGINAHAVLFDGQYLLRLSCHLYNEAQEYERLADATAEIVQEFDGCG